MTHGSGCTLLHSVSPQRANSSPASVRHSAASRIQSIGRRTAAETSGRSGTLTASAHFCSMDENWPEQHDMTSISFARVIATYKTRSSSDTACCVMRRAMAVLAVLA